MSQDFSHINLQGRSFKNQDLTGANFIYADIRGTDFTGANLNEANFSHAKAGLQLHQAIFLLIFSLFLSILSGIFATLTGVLIIFSFNSDSLKIYSVILGVLCLILLIIFFVITIYQGLAAGARVVLFLGVAIIGGLSVAGVVAVAIAVAATGIIAGVTAVIVTGFLVAIAVIAVIVTATIKGAMVGALIGAGFIGGWVMVVTIAGGFYFAWVALAGDDTYDSIRVPGITFCAIVGGTSFRGANLTNANFSYATLKNTDFLGANLTNTCWKEAKKLDQSRVDNSILAKKAVRELLVSGNGYKKSYVEANLQGANLDGANLNEANLKEANISQANLQRANLEGANLTKVQAIGTDFTNAYLTGACLEAWTIHNTTKLDDVDVRFFYILEEVDSEDETHERCPSSGEFAGGEFINLFAEVLDSVDLIFQKQVNWKAFGVAFKELKSANQGLKLFIRSIENPTDGVVVINMSVPNNANKGEIKFSFAQSYEVALNAIEEESKAEYRKKLKGESS
ncbi:MAG: hypothetical protein HC916_00125 [Coleofasciculaceae cyanobacterium SM2_1_6]|nr:hypothetical protein [Coleofasciculaceae cyanobacterium SM2_1_6]